MARQWSTQATDVHRQVAPKAARLPILRKAISPSLIGGTQLLPHSLDAVWDDGGITFAMLLLAMVEDL
jgi:hypothetical protein|eukprot:CAMPEP_0169332276 /NCGR_PEP_ID=MMETSP1017-20121227/14633_1 /TAXON_ID=342587 /ORGANISM="Karlodinium micrum, Strain CCMP2283" /LENGTH=67 /DNA_ID=CAMNT_0009427407 /DNA_START=714 /DNA_END=917 /DNA_ORIENTATION=-